MDDDLLTSKTDLLSLKLLGAASRDVHFFFELEPLFDHGDFLVDRDDRRLPDLPHGHGAFYEFVDDMSPDFDVLVDDGFLDEDLFGVNDLVHPYRSDLDLLSLNLEPFFDDGDGAHVLFVMLITPGA